MIHRFPTRCTACGHRNTLRITLGAESRQEHTFACAGCAIPIKVALDIDFVNRIPLTIDGVSLGISQPRSTFHALENCALSDEEGTITNLDPNFLVPGKLLHQDSVFPWMYESMRVGMLDDPLSEGEGADQKHRDILIGVGGIRELRTFIAALSKAWTLHRSGQHPVRDAVLGDLADRFHLPKPITVLQLAELCANLFLLRTGKPVVDDLLFEARDIRGRSRTEYDRLRHRFVKHADEALSRPIGLLEEYARAYDQLSQTLIYAIRNVPIEGPLVASSKELRAVSMFYGNCFEDLAAGFELPACLNNIREGRPFDEFAEMPLRKYLTINKAGRAKPFASNARFHSLFDEFESSIRNASHHRAMRVHHARPDVIEYRSGDAGQWKEMQYADYLLRCNRILMCALRLMRLQIFVMRDDL